MNIATIATKYLNAKIGILKKELESLQMMIAFYLRDDQKYECYSIYKVFEQISKQLKSLKLNIDTLEFNHDNSNLNFIIDYDIVRKKIQKYLSILDRVDKNLIQSIEIGLNQYLPKPNSNRLYSYKSINEFLVTDINNFVKNLLGKNNLDLNIYWEHYDNLKNKHFEEHYFFSSSYYHQDIPQLFAILGHELGHLAIREDFVALKNIKELIEDGLKNIFSVDVVESLSEEISADIFGALLYGDGFLMTALFELMSKGFSDTFYDEAEDRIRVIPFDNYDLRDHSVIRLVVLYLIYDTVVKHPDKSMNVKNLYREYIDILDIDLKDAYQDKSKYFKTIIESQLSSYFDTARVVSDIINQNQSKITIVYNNISVACSTDKQLFSSNIYTDLWNFTVYGKTKYYAGRFRENLLKDFTNNANISPTDISHKIAVFGKVAHFKIENTTELESFYTKKNFLFGIYNFFEIITIDDTIDTDRDIDFFIYQNLLMQLAKSDNNKYYGVFNISITVRIDENCKIKNLKDALNYMKDMLEDCQYTIYKSLGPKELFCDIKNMSIKKLYDLKLNFASYFPKTHTYIYISKDITTTQKIYLDEIYFIDVLIRVKKDFSITNKYEEYSLYHITGIYDYGFRIDTKYFTLKQLFEIISDKDISDVQFKIGKKL